VFLDLAGVHLNDAAAEAEQIRQAGCAPMPTPFAFAHPHGAIHGDGVAAMTPVNDYIAGLRATADLYRTLE